MPYKRTSIIWTFDLEKLKEVVKNAQSITEILKIFGLQNKGSNFKTLMKRLKEQNIDFSHIKLGKTWVKDRKFSTKKIKPLDEILIIDSDYNRGKLKTRLIKNGLLINKCYKCGLLPYWNNEPLSIQIDHINGISNDNRLENLRMLCPNCHSQTASFAGRNTKKKEKKYCIDCKKIIANTATRCKKCTGINKRNLLAKTQWPSDEELINLVNSANFCKVAEKLGVSDKAIRNRLKRRSLLSNIVKIQKKLSK